MQIQPGDDEDGVVDVPLWEVHRRMCQEWDNLDVEGLAEILEGLTNCLVNIHDSEGVLEQQRAWLVSVATDAGTLVEPVLRLSLSRLCDSISFFRTASKLQYVLVRVFRTLVAKGFCSENKSEDDADGDGAGDVSEMKFEDNVEGTGMGEGDGKEDVTDQLESEEQLLGLKDDNPNEPNEDGKDPKKLEEEEAKKGMEMDADFSGDMFDVPDDTKEPEGDDDDEEELDREMGNGADDNEEVVDEKMWGDSDDEDEINREDEKFEKDSKTKGEAIDEEMRTKEDDEDKTEGGKSEPQAQSKDEKPPTDDTDEREPDINEDLEENYEEKHHGVDVRAEEETKGEDDDDMDLGDDLNLNDDMEGSQDDDADKDPNDEPNPVGTDEEEGNAGAEDQPNIDDEIENNQEDEDSVLETGCVHDGAAVEPSEENLDEDEPEGPRVNQSNEEKSQQEAFGVRSQDGTDNVKEHGEEGEEENAQEGQTADESAGKGDDEKPKDPSLGSVGNQGSGGQREEGFGANEISSSQPEAPNPFKNPGDASAFWHKKLKMVESGQDNSEEEVVPRDDNIDDDAPNKSDGEFEYTNENEASTSQVLGEAFEEQISPFADQRHDPEEERAEEDKAVMEQHAQQREESSSRKNSKPTPSSNTREQDQCDDEEDILEDESDIQGNLSDSDDAHETDIMDDELVERGNQVVSGFDPVSYRR